MNLNHHNYPMTVVASRTGKGLRPFLFVYVAAGKPSPRNGGGYAPRGDVVEIYDMTYAGQEQFSPAGIGQFVSDYAVETLLQRSDHVGLDMMGSEPAWKLDVDAAAKLNLFAYNHQEGE